IEATFAVNHLGYFLLTNLLLDLMVKSAPARIVNVASVGHYGGSMDFDDLGFEHGYKIMRAYRRSKLPKVLFTPKLSDDLEDKGVPVNAVQAGAVARNIWRHAARWTRPVFAVLKGLFMISSEEGANPIVYLATSPEVSQMTGLYFEKNRPREPADLAKDKAV